VIDRYHVTSPKPLPRLASQQTSNHVLTGGGGMVWRLQALFMGW
jgi:hypothetical protein